MVSLELAASWNLFHLLHMVDLGSGLQRPRVFLIRPLEGKHRIKGSFNCIEEVKRLAPIGSAVRVVQSGLPQCWRDILHALSLDSLGIELCTFVPSMHSGMSWNEGSSELCLD